MSFGDAFSDPEEGPLLRALLANAEDLPSRTQYLELLERRGDPRAQLLRLANQLLAGIADDDQRRAVAVQVSELSRDPFDWWSRGVARSVSLQNCGSAIEETPQVRFAFRCPQLWAGLRPTDDPRVRFCESCSSAVVRCDTLAEAERQALLGSCIAVPGAVMGQADARYTQMVTGRPEPADYWARHLFPAKDK